MKPQEGTSGVYRYVGSCIRKLRRTDPRGLLTQAELAQALGVPANTVSRWESGVYRPHLDDLLALAAFFGVSVARFFPPERQKGHSTKVRLLRLIEALDRAALQDVLTYAERRAGAARPLRRRLVPEEDARR